MDDDRNPNDGSDIVSDSESHDRRKRKSKTAGQRFAVVLIKGMFKLLLGLILLILLLRVVTCS